MENNKIALEISDTEFCEIVTAALDRSIFYSPKRNVVSVEKKDGCWRVMLVTPAKPEPDAA